MDEIPTDSVLQQAFRWLCERRQEYSPQDDVWQQFGNNIGRGSPMRLQRGRLEDELDWMYLKVRRRRAVSLPIDKGRLASGSNL
jgi:hypothetical protein